MTERALFSYKPGTSFVHAIPAWAKILFVPVLNVVIFRFGRNVPLFLLAAQSALCFSLRFSLREQLSDLRPVLFYAVCLCALNAVAVAAAAVAGAIPLSAESLASAAKNAVRNEETAELLVKFAVCVQSASILFKTSTSLQLREGIETIERTARRFLPCRKEAVFAETVSFFINFIPAVAKIWSQLRRAWLVRGGGTGVPMYRALLPVLFLECLEHALNTARAVENRKR